MDDRMRDLERRGKAGDLEAATGWFMELNRAGGEDYEEILEAMKLMGELQYPGLFETLEMLKEVEESIQMPPVEEGYWSTEIVMRDGACAAGIIMREDTGLTVLPELWQST